MNSGDFLEEDTSTKSRVGYAQVCGHEAESHVQSRLWMKTLLDVRVRKELVERLGKLRPDAQPSWGRMSAHQMVCHLSDSMRAALGEKYISRSTSLFKRVILKRLALWAPIPWPHGFKTRPEMDQQQGGTPPVEFSSDLEEFRTLLGRFCMLESEFAPHAMFGQMSKTERLRYAYLHIDHHLRQFKV
jgi:hypothetical protein